jgi:hypothetical protein
MDIHGGFMLLNELFYPDWRSAVWSWSVKNDDQWIGNFETDKHSSTVTINRHPVRDFLRTMTGSARETLSTSLDDRDFLWLVEVKSKGAEEYPVVFNTIHYMIREFMSRIGPSAIALCFADDKQMEECQDLVRRHMADWNVVTGNAVGKHCYILYQ